MKTQDQLCLLTLTFCWVAMLFMLNPSSAYSAEEQKNGDEDPTALPEVNVKAGKIKDTSINPTQAITTITADDLQRLQPATIFDAIRDVPGVTVSGGPRPSGMTFNVRGYGDNEDVLVKVDGVQKGFEKYRMGGTFLEPELLKSIEVQRGPQISSGSGSLGGTIIATTKDAADFLRPGEKYGMRAKFGYGSNNDEYSRSYMVYGRPDERVDILYNYSNRQSNDITLGNGSKLPRSAIESISNLLKVSLFPVDGLQLTTSVVSFKDSGLQPYDASGSSSAAGSFGFVQRAIDDLTVSQSLHYAPGGKWIDLKATFGKGHSNLDDFIPPQLGTFINPAIPGCTGAIFLGNPNNTLCNGNITDEYRYQTTTFDIANTSRILETPQLKLSLLAGFQYLENTREVTRVTENPTRNATSYPNGFNPAAPPGSKITKAVYVQPRIEIGAFSAVPGVRFDRYEVEATGGTAAILNANNEATKVELSQTTYSMGLAYQLIPDRLTLFSNYGQGFRPPLLDEYFAVNVPGAGSFGARCIPFFTPNGPASGICGNLYKPQLSESTEAGISYVNPRLFDSSAKLTAKLTYFHIRTGNLLNSLGQNTAGEIVQNGVERRNGIEFESTAQYQVAYGRLSYSRTSGSIETDVRTNPVFVPVAQNLYNGTDKFPLYTVPGNALNLTLGMQLSKAWDINIGYRKVSDRVIALGGDLSASTIVFGKQDGYELFNAGIHYRPTANLAFRLLGENLANKEYNLDGGFGGSIGLPAPGRNVRFIAELTY